MMMVRPLLAYWPSVTLVILAALAPPMLPAQHQKYEGLQVLNIQFDPKVQPLDPAELHDILPLKTNQPLRIAQVRASIERLFATGRYADIQVDAEPYGTGVLIRFITRSSWFIGNLSMGGRVSSPPNSGQLENATRLDLGQLYTEISLQGAVTGIQRLLENNGFFQSQVHPVFDYETGRSYQQVNIRFDLAQGPRARFSPPVTIGDTKVDPSRILSATKFRRWIFHTWKPMTQTRVRQGLDGVRALYQKENRLEAKVSLESMKYEPATNSAIPTLRIDAGPRIEVHTIGAKISQKKLQRYVPIFEEHAVDHDLLVEGARNLQDSLQSGGYFDAQVAFKEQRVTNDRASIDYLVNTGLRHKLVAIHIAGNRYFQTEMLRERMYLQPASFLQFPHGRYSENLLRNDEESIVNLYQSNGFRDVKVTHRVQDDYLGKTDNIAVYLTVEEGPQYFVNDLQIDGIEKLDKAGILAKLSSVADQPFSEYNVAVDRDTILAQYFEKGFPNATFQWSFKPDAQPNRVDLHFVVNEGKQQFVRQVLASGLKFTRPGLVYRNFELNPGDPLSPTAVTDTQRRLYGLGVFARVNAAIQDPDGETDSKYVVYELDEARRYSLATGFGAELGQIGGCQQCLDAPAGATGFSPRVSVDFTRSNLWGLAHSISLRTRASTLEQRALLNYSWPRFGGRDDLSVSLTGLFENSRDVRTFDFKREEGSVQLSQKLSKATTLFYRYAWRYVTVGNLKLSVLLVPQLSQPVRVGITSINLVVDRRDDPVDPHKGIYTTADLGLAERFLGSQPNFMRFLVRNATYYPIGKRTVLARSTQFGNIYGFHNAGDPNEAIPLPERFFGGGAASHRGFPEEQAGPRDISTGFPLGGNALLFNQTELRFPLIGENLGGVLYHDAGNVYSSLADISFRVRQRNRPTGTTSPASEDFNYMVHSVGFGIRYRTPVGPLRVDLGYSINPPYFFGLGGNLQDLINAGPNPCAPGNPSASRCSVQNVSHFQYFISIGQTF
ncbi:MAG: BamA/TamA family outer membrane protein [Acidobacteriia bacterium]|nr:BamA/TamA family outer membrane protein [Terriglobia bacterium]